MKGFVNLDSALSIISSKAEVTHPNEISILLNMISSMEDDHVDPKSIKSQLEIAKKEWEKIYNLIYELRDMSVLDEMKD